MNARQWLFGALCAAALAGCNSNAVIPGTGGAMGGGTGIPGLGGTGVGTGQIAMSINGTAVSMGGTASARRVNSSSGTTIVIEGGDSGGNNVKISLSAFKTLGSSFGRSDFNIVAVDAKADGVVRSSSKGEGADLTITTSGGVMAGVVDREMGTPSARVRVEFNVPVPN